MKRVVPSVFHKSNLVASSRLNLNFCGSGNRPKSIEKYRILVICPLISNIQINKPIIRSNVFRLLLNCAVKAQAPRPECIWLRLFVCIPNTSRLSGSLEALTHISTWGGGCYLYPIPTYCFWDVTRLTLQPSTCLVRSFRVAFNRRNFSSFESLCLGVRTSFFNCHLM